MELCEEILIKALEGRRIQVKIEGVDLQKLMENECYAALQAIQKIIQSEKYSDQECFDRIEEFLAVYERLGSDGGSRHDFG